MLVDIDDPIWPYTLEQRLRPYIPIMRNWWDNVNTLKLSITGITTLECSIPGVYVRFTRTAIRSPIKNIQTFPFIPSARLQLVGIRGGSTKMVERVCMDDKFTIDEFTILCRSHIRTILNCAQIIIFIPTIVLEDTKSTLGKWLYFSKAELDLLASGNINEDIICKARLKT